MRVALHTWNTGTAEAWDAHGNVIVETDLTVAAWLAGGRKGGRS